MDEPNWSLILWVVLGGFALFSFYKVRQFFKLNRDGERGLIFDRREILKWGIIGGACLIPPVLLTIVALNS